MTAHLKVTNPYSEQPIQELSWATPQEVSGVLTSAVATQDRWRTSSSFERSQLLNALASQLDAERDDFARLIREEAGKPETYARAEVDRAIGVARWAAAEAQRFVGELLRLDTDANGREGFGIAQRFPRGVILGITPFNFPLNLVMHKVAPAIASGCSIVLKPSPSAPLTAIRLAGLFEQLVPGLVQVVLADDEATAALTRAKEVAMVSFTGSAKVGWQIRRQSPEKPSALELGGNAWTILLEDTPRESLAAIARRIAGAAYGYAGQSCISVQNIAVAEPLWAGFSAELKKATLSTAYGDPADPAVISGPVINAAAARRIEKELSLAPAGSELVRSSNRVGDSTPASLLSPTLVLLPEERPTVVPSNLVDEEIFGPVATARPFKDLELLIKRLNTGRYGLQAGLYTQDLRSINKVYRDLRVGGLVVNDVPTTRYDHQPYGGVKDSGQGREGVRYAMEEMTEPRFLALSCTIKG
jgi:acyl-CoA reductase-like NAD-dependent aldehyde dehydrogenase